MFSTFLFDRKLYFIPFVCHRISLLSLGLKFLSTFASEVSIEKSREISSCHDDDNQRNKEKCKRKNLFIKSSHFFSFISLFSSTPSYFIFQAVSWKEYSHISLDQVLVALYFTPLLMVLL